MSNEIIVLPTLIYKGIKVKVVVYEGLGVFDAESVAKQLGYPGIGEAMLAKDSTLGEIAHYITTKYDTTGE